MSKDAASAPAIANQSERRLARAVPDGLDGPGGGRGWLFGLGTMASGAGVRQGPFRTIGTDEVELEAPRRVFAGGASC
jgi:hypothetical protein